VIDAPYFASFNPKNNKFTFSSYDIETVGIYTIKMLFNAQGNTYSGSYFGFQDTTSYEDFN